MRCIFDVLVQDSDAGSMIALRPSTLHISRLEKTSSQSLSTTRKGKNSSPRTGGNDRGSLTESSTEKGRDASAVPVPGVSQGKRATAGPPCGLPCAAKMDMQVDLHGLRENLSDFSRHLNKDVTPSKHFFLSSPSSPDQKMLQAGSCSKSPTRGQLCRELRKAVLKRASA